MLLASYQLYAFPLALAVMRIVAGLRSKCDNAEQSVGLVAESCGEKNWLGAPFGPPPWPNCRPKTSSISIALPFASRSVPF